MSLALPPEIVEPFLGGLIAGISVDDGPTPQQLKVLRAIASHVWGRDDLNEADIEPIGASQLATILTDRQQREMFHEIHLTLEACRHPQTAAQVAAVQEFADALGVDGDDLEMFRDLVTTGVDQAAADYARFMSIDLAERTEPSLTGIAIDPDHPEIKLAEKLTAFSEFAPDSLGRAYITFYETFGLTLPGAEASSMNHFFVAHDMTHTIAGISTTIAGEVALSAFQFAMNNNRINRAALLASLVAHEAGFAHPGQLSHADTALLADDSAVLLLGQEMKRGSMCTADFSLVDHFEIAPMPLADVRAEFGVQRPINPHDKHHFGWA